MAKPTQLGTLAGMAGFIGVLPTLLTLGIAQRLDFLGSMSLTIIHVCLIVVGMWLFTIVFGD